MWQASETAARMMGLFRHLGEWKKLLLLIIVVYCVLCHLAYKYRVWQSGTLRGSGRILAQTVGDNVDVLLASLWNKRSSKSQSLSWFTVDGPLPEPSRTEPVIAIGGGITSRKLIGVNESNMAAKFQFFHTFLPTFCNTASPHYLYRFYLGFDKDDHVFSDGRLSEAFRRRFVAATTSASETTCRKRGITADLVLVRCDDAGKPAWAQNDAMLDAYLDHVDYFYRINDDTRMLTGGWTEVFIATLNGYCPPRLGVVGPNHFGGKCGILTYDFVHRTHVDILGYYYPHVFTAWFGDDWITRVYKPNRSTKISKIRLIHTGGLGQRYRVYGGVYHLPNQLGRDKSVIRS